MRSGVDHDCCDQNTLQLLSKSDGNSDVQKGGLKYPTLNNNLILYFTEVCIDDSLCLF